MDFYKILRVNKNATEAEIEEAANRMLMIWNPEDFEEYDSVAQRVFNDVIKAKRVLLDPVKRRNYDDKGEQISSSSSEVLIYADSENCEKYRRPWVTIDDDSNKPMIRVDERDSQKTEFNDFDFLTQRKIVSHNTTNFASGYSSCNSSVNKEDRNLGSRRENQASASEKNQNALISLSLDRDIHYELKSLQADNAGRTRSLEDIQSNLKSPLLKISGTNKGTFLRIDKEDQTLNTGNKCNTARCSVSDCCILEKDSLEANNASEAKNGNESKKFNNPLPNDDRSINDGNSNIQNNGDEQDIYQIHRNLHKNNTLREINNLKDSINLEDKEQNVNTASHKKEPVLDPYVLQIKHQKYHPEKVGKYQSSFSYINNLADKNKNDANLEAKCRSLEPSLSESFVSKDLKSEEITEEKNIQKNSKIPIIILSKSTVSNEDNNKKGNTSANNRKVQSNVNVTNNENESFGKYNFPQKTENFSAHPKFSLNNIRKYHRLRDGKEIIVDEATKEFNSRKPAKNELNDKQNHLSNSHVSAEMQLETAIPKETTTKADFDKMRENFEGFIPKCQGKMAKNSVSEQTLPGANYNSYSNNSANLKRNKEANNFERNNQVSVHDNETEIKSDRRIKQVDSEEFETANIRKVISEELPTFDGNKETIYYKNDKKSLSSSDVLQKKLNYSNSFKDIKTVPAFAACNESLYSSEAVNDSVLFCNIKTDDHCSSDADESKPKMSCTNQSKDSSNSLTSIDTSNAVQNIGESSTSALRYDNYSLRPTHSFNTVGFSNNIKDGNNQPNNSLQISKSENNVLPKYTTNTNRRNDFSSIIQGTDSSNVLTNTDSSNAVQNISESSTSALRYDNHSLRPTHIFDIVGSSNNIQDGSNQPNNSLKISKSENNLSPKNISNKNVFSQIQLNRLSMLCNSVNNNSVDEKPPVQQVKSETNLIRNNQSTKETPASASVAKIPKAISYEQVLEIDKTINLQNKSFGLSKKTALDRNLIEESSRVKQEQVSAKNISESLTLLMNVNDDNEFARNRRKYENGTKGNSEPLSDFQDGNYKSRDVIQDISAVNVSNIKSIKLKDGCLLKCTARLSMQGGYSIDITKLNTFSKTSYAEDGKCQMIKSVVRLKCLEMVIIYRFSDEKENLDVYSEGNLVCRIENDEPVEILTENWKIQDSINIPLTMTVIMKANSNTLQICRIRERRSDRIEIFKNGVLIYILDNQVTEMNENLKSERIKKNS